MALAEIQSALARLYTDAMLRDRFFAAPLLVGEQLGLSADDASDLARIPRREVDQFAQSLRRKRRDQVRRVVPNAARSIGGRRFAELFERYANESSPRGSKAGLADAAGFVAAVRRWAKDVEPPWAIDLAEYELTWRQATRSGRAPIMRIFRYPVGRLAIASPSEPVVPWTTLAIWWRPTWCGPVRHVVLSMPRTELEMPWVQSECGFAIPSRSFRSRT
jgi:hypothetical protein